MWHVGTAVSPPAAMAEAAASAALRASEPTSRGRPACCNTPSACKCKSYLREMTAIHVAFQAMNQDTHISELIKLLSSPHVLRLCRSPRLCMPVPSLTAHNQLRSTFLTNYSILRLDSHILTVQAGSITIDLE